jgi:hypothetical protein
MWERTGEYRILEGKPEGRKHWENLVLGGRIILKWILEKWFLAWTVSMLLRAGTGGRL